ncbi:MAG: polysaccharide ABC transporter ATP-binding protein [Methanotrichaceae archaeon]|jgi:lipopolysaccharide transport system ATP-binding protein
MTRDIAIRAKNLGKQYQIGQCEQYKTLRDAIAAAAKAPFCRIKDSLSSKNGNHNQSFIWALKDVSFEVEQGDVVGIIGRNGSGKSTLLKILSRITTPTEGTAEIHGRVGSLLEVGTGFHPELTGRENIYLSGSILGMRKREIEDKFDEIVKFSEIEKFLDTPVKRYSSGMYVRLAFAVAAHLDPEILMVDEVLAVGDAAFQKKCLNKMGSVAREGRTVLFVSHNMNAIEQLCKSCLLLENGTLKHYSNDVYSVTKEYLFRPGNIADASEWINSGNELDNPWFKPLRFYIADNDNNKLLMPLTNNTDAWIYLEAEVKTSDPALNIGYAIYTPDGNLVYWSVQTDEAEGKWPEIRPGKCILRSKIPKRLLNEGTYRIELIGSLYNRSWLFKQGDNIAVIYLTIHGALSDSPFWMSKRPGIIAPVIGWESYDNSSHF